MMFGRPTDIELDRLRIEGLDLAPEQAELLARMIEAEIRLIVAGGSAMFVSADVPIPMTSPPDIADVAHAVAARVVGRVDHG